MEKNTRKTSVLLKRFVPYYRNYMGILVMDLFCAALTTVCDGCRDAGFVGFDRSYDFIYRWALFCISNYGWGGKLLYGIYGACDGGSD